MVNDRHLLCLASRHNGGLPCELDPSDHLGEDRMGGMHVHLRIVFVNGTKWLARILRHNYTSFSDDFSNRCLDSECATLRWLESIDVPAPRLHDYGLRNDPNNEVGAAYMLIDELPGAPLLNLKPSEEQSVQEVCRDSVCNPRAPFSADRWPLLSAGWQYRCRPHCGRSNRHILTDGPFYLCTGILCDMGREVS